ncbi:hypothetical protein DFJ73DRAFT_179860 [Zopfochytrium polystomum]|nr:hypothetical protein DFJ73DRAFT_179860 [Zopfochytrium polystomum]
MWLSVSACLLPAAYGSGGAKESSGLGGGATPSFGGTRVLGANPVGSPLVMFGTPIVSQRGRLCTWRTPPQECGPHNTSFFGGMASRCCSSGEIRLDPLIPRRKVVWGVILYSQP